MHDFQKEFLLTNSKSDKLTHHGYHRIYPWFLEHFRNQHVKLLEIGIHATESIKLWRGYFNDVSIYGIDIDEKKFDDENVHLFQVDQSSDNDLKKFVDTVNTSFSIIIDDGSHVPSHQIKTFEYLWPLIIPGGVYIVEDIETSYWGQSSIYGYNFDSNAPGSNFIKYAMNCITKVNNEFINSEQKNSLQRFPDDIEMVTFGYNSVIFIKKDPSSFSRFYNRPYKLSNLVNNFSG